MNNVVDSHEFAEGEKFNLVMFSHGGNVGKEFTQIYNGDKKIDNIVFLGTPHRPDYQLDFNDISKAAMNKVNIYDVGDGVQTRGYIDGSVLKGIITIPKPIRRHENFINIFVDQDNGLISNHTNLPSFKIWDENVDPIINY